MVSRVLKPTSCDLVVLEEKPVPDESTPLMDPIESSEWTPAIDSIWTKVQKLLLDPAAHYAEDIRAEFGRLSDREKLTLFTHLLGVAQKITATTIVTSAILSR
jgi:hypothetical protein